VTDQTSQPGHDRCAAAHHQDMTSPAPAITKVSLNINVDQDDPGTLSLGVHTLGVHPYVVVQMSADDQALVLDVEVGGREMSMKTIGDALEMIAKTFQGKGDDLTAQAKDAGGQIRVEAMASAFFADEPATVDERTCICDGGSYFTAEQNASRHPFLVNDDCPFHGTDAKGGSR
jgi:hypothetical protein